MKRHPFRLDKFAATVKDAICPQRSGELPPLQALAAKYTQLLVLSWRGFNADLCPLRASALTLYTLLSIVPVFAMLFGIAKGFGMDAMLRERLLEQFREQREITFKLIDFAQSLLARTQGELVAGIGIALLFWSVMSVIGEIEKSFNYIWQVEKGRVFAQKKIAALRIVQLLVHKFAAAEPPLTSGEIAHSLHLPLAAVQGIIAELLEARILARVQSGAAEAAAYQPARDIGLLRIATIIEALENGGNDDFPETGTPDRFGEITAQFAATIRNSPENRLLKDV
jgi:hypothetical protein